MDDTLLDNDRFREDVAVFQPRKLERAGIREVVRGDVLVYAHKEKELDDVERRYPAERYVLVDDTRELGRV